MNKRPLVRVVVNGDNLDVSEYVSCLFMPAKSSGQLWRKFSKENDELRNLIAEFDEGELILFADPQGQVPVLRIQGNLQLTVVTHSIDGTPMIIEELRIIGDVEYL